MMISNLLMVVVLSLSFSREELPTFAEIEVLELEISANC